MPDSTPKVTATSKGFAIAGVSGHQANGDVVLWASQDGREWKRVKQLPESFDGPGDQELTSITGSGTDLLAVRSGIGPQQRGLLLWRTPAP